MLCWSLSNQNFVDALTSILFFKYIGCLDFSLLVFSVLPTQYYITLSMLAVQALRLIKYAVGKSGNDFKREMQRHSAAMRQLVHYKGHPDPLRGDALNKAVRETANEAIAAIFSTEDPKPAVATESLGKRIQGFGNTNYEPSRIDDKKSFLSELNEVVGIGSASIKQGLSNFAAAHAMMTNDNGATYKSPNLRRSLTTESERYGRYDPSEIQSESRASSGASKNAASGSWGPTPSSSTPTDDTSSSQPGIKTREERLLETIVTASGVRLQPTRDALQIFLTEASKLDAVALSRALENKLNSPLWQVSLCGPFVIVHFTPLVSTFTVSQLTYSIKLVASHVSALLRSGVLNQFLLCC